MLQDVRLQCISEVLKVITREFGIDSLVHELKPDEGKKTLISLKKVGHHTVTRYTSTKMKIQFYDTLSR